MVRRDEEKVVVGLASLVDLADGLVGSSNTLDGGIVDTSVAYHVRGSEVVHDELKLALGDALGHLLANASSAHLGVLVVGGDLGRGDHVAHFTRELLFDTTVEEECNVSVLLGLGDVALLDVLLAEPLGEHVTHVLRGEGNGEGVVGLVLGHSSDADVLRVGEVSLGRAVVVTEQLGDLADTVGTVVEEEQGVVIWKVLSVFRSLGSKIYANIP